MTIAELRRMTAEVPGDTAVLLYIDRAVPVQQVADQPVAYIDGYFEPRAEQDRDALVLIADRKAG